MWHIIDNNGIIHSGTQWEMKKAFFVMTNEIHEIQDNYGVGHNIAQGWLDDWDCDWEGDLILVEEHGRER